MTIVEQTREMIAKIKKLVEENRRLKNEVRLLRLRIQALLEEMADNQ